MAKKASGKSKAGKGAGGYASPLRVRALRVTVTREEDGSRWKYIVFEDVDTHRFRGTSSSGGGRTPDPEVEPALDRLDAWNAVKGLREMGLHPETARSYWPSDSLDALVYEDAQRMWEMMDRHKEVWEKHKETNPEPPAQPPSTENKPRSMIVAMRSDLASGDLSRQGMSPEEMRKASETRMQIVWDYAGNNAWEWKSLPPTPAGYRCDVLTFSGSETVQPGPDSLEICN